MSRLRYRWLAGVLVSVLTLGMLYTARQRLRKAEQSVQEQVAEEQLQQTERDQKTVSSVKSSPEELSIAFRRLAHKQDLLGRTYALKHTSSPHAMVRGSVATVLGAFQDTESFDALKKLTTDSEFSVRRSALEALTQQSTEERVSFIKDLANSNTPPQDRLVIMAALYRLTRSKKALGELVSAVSKDSAEDLKALAANYLMELAPQEPETLQWLRTQVREGLDSPVPILRATYYLAAARDPWLLKQLDVLLKNDSPRIREAMVRVFHFVCPENRWQLLENIMLTDPSREVAEAAAREILFMPEATGRELLKRVASDQEKSARIQAAISETLQALERLPETKRCPSPFGIATHQRSP